MPGSKDTGDTSRIVTECGSTAGNITSSQTSGGQIEEKELTDFRVTLSTDERLEDSIEGFDLEESTECDDLVDPRVKWESIKDLSVDMELSKNSSEDDDRKTETPPDCCTIKELPEEEKIITTEEIPPEENNVITGEITMEDNAATTKVPEKEDSTKLSDSKMAVNQHEENGEGSKVHEIEERMDEKAVPGTSRRYSLRQSTLISSRSVPWYQRFPPQASKVSLRRSKRNVLKSSKKTKPKSEAYLKKNFKLPPAMKESKSKGNKSSPMSVPQLKKNFDHDDQLDHATKNQKNKENTDTSANQPDINSKSNDDMKPKEYTIINHHKKFKQYLFMGYNYNTGFGEDNNSPSITGKTHQSNDKTEAFTAETSEKKNDSNILTKTHGQKSSVADREKKYHENLCDSSVRERHHEKSKIAMQDEVTEASSSRTEVERKEPNIHKKPTGDSKGDTKKKISRLITPYQILKGKAAIRNEYNLSVLKGAPGPENAYRKSLHDCKSKLVTPSQILKGKERQEKKKSGGVKVDDADRMPWEPSRDCESESSSPERGYELHRSDACSASHNPGIDADEDTEDEDVKPRRTKIRVAGNRGRRENKDRIKRRKKRRERFPEVEDRMSSSVDEIDRSED